MPEQKVLLDLEHTRVVEASDHWVVEVKPLLGLPSYRLQSETYGVAFDCVSIGGETYVQRIWIPKIVPVKTAYRMAESFNNEWKKRTALLRELSRLQQGQAQVQQAPQAPPQPAAEEVRRAEVRVEEIPPQAEAGAEVDLEDVMRRVEAELEELLE